MLNPKETLKSIKALLSSEAVFEEVVETPVEEVALEEVKEEATKEVALEEAPVEEAPAEEEAPQDEFVSVAVFEEAISMLIAEIEALKGNTEEEAPSEEPKEEELSAEVDAEESTELSVHNPEVRQVKNNANKARNTKESVWNIING
jgi:uncharacterized small protein (DUF1192 family)